MGSKLGSLETRIEGIAGQIRTDLRLDLKKDLEEMFEKWGRKVEQMVSPTKDTITEKMTTVALEMGSPGGQQKSTGDSSGSDGILKVGYAPVVQEPDSQTTHLESFRFDAHKSKIECPRFDGHDFLGWHMKVEQFFEAVRIPIEEKVQTVMIHLDDKAL